MHFFVKLSWHPSFKVANFSLNYLELFNKKFFRRNFQFSFHTCSIYILVYITSVFCFCNICLYISNIDGKTRLMTNPAITKKKKMQKIALVNFKLIKLNINQNLVQFITIFQPFYYI